MIASVLVELNSKQTDKMFYYNVPSILEDKVTVGIRVIVPFGQRKLEGFVLELTNKKLVDCSFELKDILEIVDDKPVLNDEMLKLGRYISKKTLSTLISAYQIMLPSALKARKGFMVNKKYVTYIRLVDKNYVPTSKKQEEIISLLKDKDVLKKDCSLISTSALKKLIDEKVVEQIQEEVYRIDDNVDTTQEGPVLTSEQLQVIESVKFNSFKPYLLHGVTGSGKTEVYMNLIEKVINTGKEAIVLVPEISLTPQLVSVFKKRFGKKIAILHSALNDGEKYDEWRKIENKEVSIVIGARSAIFAPFTNIGIIIIDEEHSATYKQENNPRYSAIDIALYRAKIHNAPVILGSATPSIESYTRAKMGVYELLELKNKIYNNNTDVMLIDMKDEIKKGNFILSEALKENIKECLQRGEQVIILLNRRGFSTIISCSNCGYVDKCPNCDIPLIYHKSTNSMQCHYCNYIKSKTIKCPKCNNTNLNNYGMGTEKLEEYVKEIFNDARVVRMDVDSTTKKGSHERIINEFLNHKYDILIGTQMISKGLDFPNVTLVGVVNADSSLNIPDFRSAERTFQLLNQVSGRTGRGRLNGRVIMQGFNMDHYSIITASKSDYESFYKQEMELRKKLKYPPYYNLCSIVISSKKYEETDNEALKIGKYLKDNLKNNVIILGPSPSSIPKINNKYYFQIIIKYKNTDEIIDALCFINEQYKSNNKVNVDIDLNPIRV